MEQYLIGGVIGAAFGFAVANISAALTRRGMKKDSTNAVMAASMLRTLMDLLALLVVYLLRNTLPFPFYGVIVGTALGLSVSNIVLASRISRNLKNEQTEKKSEIDDEVK